MFAKLTYKGNTMSTRTRTDYNLYLRIILANDLGGSIWHINNLSSIQFNSV